MAHARDLTDKVGLRKHALGRRRARAATDRARAARHVDAHVVNSAQQRGWRTVCGYVPTDSEPGSRAMIDCLLDRGVRVMVPVLTDAWDLDWTAYAGPESLRPGPAGILEGVGDLLGRDAVALAAAVLVPALLVDASGYRLGRGAGCYDRALRRAPSATELVAVIYDDERVDALPHEAHDVPVTAVIAPGPGLVPLPARTAPEPPSGSAGA